MRPRHLSTRIADNSLLKELPKKLGDIALLIEEIRASHRAVGVSTVITEQMVDTMNLAIKVATIVGASPSAFRSWAKRRGLEI